MRLVFAATLVRSTHSAVQACEHYMDAETMQEAAKGMVKSKEILELETAVLQCLQFDLVVYEPFALVDAVVEVCCRDDHQAVLS